MADGTNKEFRPKSVRSKALTRVAEGDIGAMGRSTDIFKDMGARVFESFIANSGPLLSEEELGPRVAIYLVQRIASSLHKKAELVASKYNLHVTDVYVLLLLHRSQPDCVAAAADLQKALSFTSGGMTRRLDRLSELALVERIHNPKDRRSWLVGLTKTGKGIAEDIRRCNKPQFNEPHSDISKPEWSVLIDLLQGLLRTVTDDTEQKHSNSLVDTAANNAR
jgi:DNA-binding MarR family transcriptional regulator